MEEEKKCSRKIKKLVACPRGTGENIKCFVERKSQLDVENKDVSMED